MQADEGQVTAPHLISVKSFGSKQIMLTWEQAEGADGYLIYRTTPGNAYTQIAQLDGEKNTSYCDFSVEDGQYYQYAVSSFQNGVISEMSDYICAATAFQLPVFYNGEFTEVSSTGFTFSGDFLSTYPVQYVRFKIWVTDYYEQTCRIFNVLVEKDNHFSVRIDAQDYGSLSGEYILYIDGYGEDSSKSIASYTTSVLVPKGTPEIQNPTLTSLSTKGYGISCNLYTESEAQQIYVYTYKNEDLSDLHYEEYELNGSYLNAEISLENYTTKAGTYHTAVILADQSGREDRYQFDVEVPEEEEPFISFSPIFVEHGDSLLLQSDGHYLLLKLPIPQMGFAP